MREHYVEGLASDLHPKKPIGGLLGTKFYRSDWAHA